MTDDRAKRSRTGALARGMRIAVEDALRAIPKVPFADRIDTVCASVRRTLERCAPEWHSNVRVRALGGGQVLVSFDVPRHLWDRMVRQQRRDFRPKAHHAYAEAVFFSTPLLHWVGRQHVREWSAGFTAPPLGRDRGGLAREGSISGSGLAMVVGALAGAKRFRDAGRRALYLARQTAGFDARAHDPVEDPPA